MKKILTGTLAVLAGLALLLSAAMADTLTLTGTVTAGEAVPVYAPIGGTVGDILTEEGQQVVADDVLYAMKTDKVYAEEDGVVTGVFGQPGDSAETVAGRYGAVLYLEGTSVFSVSASTSNAYNSTETKFVHVGETVYLLCRTSSDRSGMGVITSVSGTDYQVRVESGTFIPGDSVDVYRDEAHTNAQKIGRGTVSRTAPTAVSASGSIVRIAVQNGDQVKRGDLLLETLNGTFDGLYMSGTEIAAGQAGVVGSLSVSRGGSVQKGSVAAVIYPLEGMRVEASVPEDSRNMIKEGDKVVIELEADESRTYEGTVTLVSSVAENGNGETTYRVLVDFVPDEAVTFGMSVVLTTVEEEEPAEETEPAEDTEPAEEAATEKEAEQETEEAASDEKKRERPEGWSPENMPEGWTPGGEAPDGFPGRPDSESVTEGTESNENAEQ